MCCSYCLCGVYLAFISYMNKYCLTQILVLLFSLPVEGRLFLRGSLILPLPEDCPDTPSDIVYDGTGGHRDLYILNEFERKVEVFDLGDKSRRTLNLNPKPNYSILGLGVQDERVFMYNYRKGTVYSYKNGNYENSYEVKSDTEVVNGRRMIPLPYVQTLSPIKVYGETLIMAGFRPGESQRSPDIPDMVLCLLDLKSGRVVNVVEMPEIYGKYNWGGGFGYRMPYFDLNDEGEVICCFAASEMMTVYSLKTGRQRQVNAPSKYFGQIEPYSRTNKKAPANDIQWYRNNPSYDGILYDPWRGVYYRLALLPERPDRRGTEDFLRKPVSIIVLDKDLRPIEETLLDESVWFRPYCSFVSPEGLFIQVRTGDEDNMTFYQYQYEKEG